MVEEISNFVQTYVHRRFCSLVLGILDLNYKLEWFTKRQFEVLWTLNICTIFLCVYKSIDIFNVLCYLFPAFLEVVSENWENTVLF